jgi:carbon storage regulator CsrA
VADSPQKKEWRLLMLVLSRKRNQKIVLEIEGRKVELTVVRIEANGVRIGIEADKDITILRSELVGKAHQGSSSEVV